MCFWAFSSSLKCSRSLFFFCNAHWAMILAERIRKRMATLQETLIFRLDHQRAPYEWLYSLEKRCNKLARASPPRSSLHRAPDQIHSHEEFLLSESRPQELFEDHSELGGISSSALRKPTIQLNGNSFFKKYKESQKRSSKEDIRAFWRVWKDEVLDSACHSKYSPIVDAVPGDDIQRTAFSAEWVHWNGLCFPL